MEFLYSFLKCGCGLTKQGKKQFGETVWKYFFLTAIYLVLSGGIPSNTFAQWTQVGTQLTGLTSGAPRISVVDSNIVWVAGGNGGTVPKVYRTTDGGLHWVSLPTAGLPYFLTAIAAKDSLTAFVADVGGSFNGGNAKLYKTTDAGLNWTVIDSTGGTTGFYDDIQFSKSNPQFGIAMSDPANGPGGFFIVNITTDGGNT